MRRGWYFFIYISVLSLLWAGPAFAQCGVYKTWALNEILTSSDLNLAFQRTVDANTPICAQGYSASVSQMQVVTDPFPSGSESLATNLAGELERLRFQLKALVGKSQWYAVADNSVAKDVPKHWGATYTKYVEIADPAPPGVNEGALYFKDDGAGNTVLAYEDHNGTVNTLTGPSSSFGGNITMNLNIKRNVGTPNSQLDVSADRISVAGFIKTGFAVTIDAEAVGQNGIDTGAFAPSTFYYIWLIYRPTTATFAALLSTSETNPTLPALFTKKRLIGGWATNGPGAFIDGSQRDNQFSYNEIVALVNMGVGGPNPVSLVGLVPAQSVKNVTVTWRAATTSGTSIAVVSMHWVSFTPNAGPFSYDSAVECTVGACSAGGTARLPMHNPSNPSTFYYFISAGQFIDMQLAGWEMQWRDP